MGHLYANKWIGPVFLAVLGAGAFWDGLYGPAQQLIAVTLAALLAGALRGTAHLARLEALALLLLAAGAGLSLWAPASAGVAAHGPAVAAGWLLALVAGRMAAGRGSAEGLLARFWAMAATLMAFGGMVAISFTPVHHSGRLAAFLGYPIAVGVLGLLGLAGSLPDLAAGRRWAPVLALGSGLSILLSGSRGVWAVGLALAAYLAWAAPGLLRRAFRGTAVGLGTALAAGLWAAPAVSQRDGRTLAAILLVSLLTVLLLETFQRSRALLALAAAAGLAALALAPGWPWFLGRATALSLTEGSSVERFTMLQDGWRLVMGLPLGAGYRAWNALHLQAASYGYYSAEVHSAPLDMAIAFGWAGGSGFLLLLGRFLWQLRHGRRWGDERLVALAGLGALALHALLDWDLSYGLFAFPLWFGLGLAVPEAAPAGPVRWPPWLTVGLAGFALAVSALLGAGDLFTALAGEALRRGAPEAALMHGAAAVAVTPWNDLSHAYLGQARSRLGLKEQAVASLIRARQHGPREPWYAQLLARELAESDRWEEAAATWREAVRLWPWEVAVYEEALQGHLDLIRRARGAGEERLAVELAESGQAVLQALDEQKGREPAGRPRRAMQTDTPAIAQARAAIGQALGR